MKPRVMVLFAAVLHGCGEAVSSSHGSLPASDPYVQTLRAMKNLKGCKGLRGQSTVAAEPKRSEELISKAQLHLNGVEAFARSKGLGDYLERGRISFERQVAEELNVLCDPGQQGASERAHEAIEGLRVHVVQLSLSGG